MKLKSILRKSTALAGAGMLLGAASNALAQDASDDEEIEAVIVTGSYIKRKSFNSPSPISTIDRGDIEDLGVFDLSNLIKTMPINVGSEFNPDAFTQNVSAGTGNFNLRGLGLNSTLILINGRRQTLSGSRADDGSTFVDTNSIMPLIMVQRIEILKDGASALYGTDAIAGVVNFIPRTRFEGFEFEFEGSTTTENDQSDLKLSAIFGWANDSINWVVSASYLDRNPLFNDERSFSTATKEAGTSVLGQPGALIGLAPAFGGLIPPGVPIIDPACAGGQDSTPNVIVPLPPPLVGIGYCDLFFAGEYNLVVKEERFQAFTTLTADLTDNIEFYGEFGVALNTADRSNSPSFPGVTFPFVPANNPGNFLGVPAIMIGRIIGNDGPENISDHTNNTYRAVAALNGDFDNGWSGSLSVGYSWHKNFFAVSDQLTDRTNAALNGFGGPNGDQFLIPFLGIPSDPALIDFITGRFEITTDTSLLTVDGVVTGDIFEMPAGPVGIAIGAQYRRDDLKADADENFNNNNFVFIFGGPDIDADQDVYAFFVELAIPIHETAEIQAAIRYEDYGTGPSDTLDPKIALLWQPVDEFSLRASFSTSFRAPTVLQGQGSITVVSQILDPLAGSSFFLPIITAGNPDLKPEEANVYNIGFSWEPVTDFTVSVDYWRFEYSGIIAVQDPQGIVNANPFDPRVVRGPSGLISRIDTAFINAPSVDTDGFDISMSYRFDAGDMGNYRLGFDATYVNEYKFTVTPGGATLDGAGHRNFGSFPRSNPEWRGNVSLNWLLGGHGAAVYVRYIDSYINEQPDDDGIANTIIPSHVTVDVQYYHTLPDFVGSSSVLSIGAINVFDNQLPAIATLGGFDSKVHDPRGRVVYLKLRQSF